MDSAISIALAGTAKPTGPLEARLTGPGADKSSYRVAAEEFEAVFLNTVLDGMFAGIEAPPPFGGGSSEKTYRSLLLSEYAKQISQSGGLGIADQITRDLIAIQEDAQR